MPTRLEAIDASAALTIPGVLAVLTGADLLADKVGGIPCGWGITGKDGLPMKEPAHPAMAQGKVRYVGDAVAFVVAETVELAQRRRGAGGRIRRAAGGGRGARCGHETHRGCSTTCRAICAATGKWAIARRWMRRLPMPLRSRGSAWSIIGWSATRWNRAPQWPI